MSLEKSEILQQIRSLLFYHEQSGLNSYPRAAELESFLRIECHDKKIKTPEVIQQTASVSQDKPVVTEGGSARQRHTIDEIAEEVRTCNSCDLYKGRIAPISGAGGHDVQLLIVGGWLTAPSPAEIHKSSVFGREEDLMLSRMLGAIHLPQETAFITNVIKCGITATVQPRKENFDACVSYLYRQIAVTSPDVICAMGIIATRALLQSSKPLSQLRGRFHDYRQGEQKIALMPTYHPSFLLKNPEMKMATWNDLQLIEKRFKN